MQRDQIIVMVKKYQMLLMTRNRCVLKLIVVMTS